MDNQHFWFSLYSLQTITVVLISPRTLTLKWLLPVYVAMSVYLLASVKTMPP